MGFEIVHGTSHIRDVGTNFIPWHYAVQFVSMYMTYILNYEKITADFSIVAQCDEDGGGSAEGPASESGGV